MRGLTPSPPFLGLLAPFLPVEISKYLDATSTPNPDLSSLLPDAFRLSSFARRSLFDLLRKIMNRRESFARFLANVLSLPSPAVA